MNLADATQNDRASVDPILSDLRADSRYNNVTSVSTKPESIKQPSVNIRTPTSVARSQTSIENALSEGNIISSSPSEPMLACNVTENQTLCSKSPIDKLNDIEPEKVFSNTEAITSQMFAFKNEIVKEIKEQIRAEFAKYKIPELFKTVADAATIIQAKCDALDHGLVPPSNQIVSNIPQDHRPNRPRMFNKIRTIHELKALNEKAKNPAYVTEYVDQMSIHYGKDSCIKKGRSAAMKLIDKTVDREVFKECCWTGKGRGREKFKFGDLQAFMHMFYCAVRYSDPTFTMVENESFLRSCLSNAGARADNPEPSTQQSQRKRVSKNYASATPAAGEPPQLVRVFSNDGVQILPRSHLPEEQPIQFIYLNNKPNQTLPMSIKKEI